MVLLLTVTALAQFWRVAATLAGNVETLTQVVEFNTKPMGQDVQIEALLIWQDMQGDWHCTQTFEAAFRKEPGKQVRQTAGLFGWQDIHRLEAVQAIHTPVER